MTQLSLILPEIGSPSKTEDPKTDNAFIAIQAWANGNIDATNLKAEGVSRESLANVKSSIIATEETRTNVAYGKLTTPDEITLTVRTSGLIEVAYQAQWKESVQNAARASIFIGANQLKIDVNNKPTAQEVAVGGGTSTAGQFRTLASCTEGLQSASNTGPAEEDVTTGQVVGQVVAGSAGLCGAALIFAAAGTYVISVQFKSTSGTVSARNRKLWAWAVGP